MSNCSIVDKTTASVTFELANCYNGGSPITLKRLFTNDYDSSQSSVIKFWITEPLMWLLQRLLATLGWEEAELRLK